MSGKPTILWHYLALHHGYWELEEMLLDLYIMKKCSLTEIGARLGVSRKSVSNKIKETLGERAVRPRGRRN